MVELSHTDSGARLTSEPTYIFCIGATKAGTSWLYRYLADHPDCYFRTIKELHYFNKLTEQQFHQGAIALEPQIVRLETGRTFATPTAALRTARKLVDLGDWKTVLDEGEVVLPAYRSFLSDGRGGKTHVGDVTPAYALLPPNRLKLLLKVGSDVRMVFLMRDPIARLWSHVRMTAMRTAPKAFSTEAPALLQRILAGEDRGEPKAIRARGDYKAILQQLGRAVEPARLLVMFYEDLMTVCGVTRLADYLGIARHPGKFGDRAFGGTSLALPEDLRKAALTYLRPQYDYVAKHHRPLPDAWVNAMEEGFA